MKIHQLLLIVLFFIGAHSQCSTTLTEMSFYSCKVYTENCEQGFIFHSCLERYCVYYRTTYRNGTSSRTCALYDYRTLSELQCLVSCCGDIAGGNVAFDSTLVKQCFDENERLTSLTVIILCSIFGGLFLLGGAYIFYRRK